MTSYLLTDVKLIQTSSLRIVHHIEVTFEVWTVTWFCENEILNMTLTSQQLRHLEHILTMNTGPAPVIRFPLHGSGRIWHPTNWRPSCRQACWKITSRETLRCSIKTNVSLLSAGVYNELPQQQQQQLGHGNSSRWKQWYPSLVVLLSFYPCWGRGFIALPCTRHPCSSPSTCWLFICVWNVGRSACVLAIVRVRSACNKLRIKSIIYSCTHTHIYIYINILLLLCDGYDALCTSNWSINILINSDDESVNCLLNAPPCLYLLYVSIFTLFN